MDVTSELLACLNESQVEKVLVKQIKKTSGWDVTSVEFKNSIMTIFVRGVNHIEQLLVVDLIHGQVAHGRLGIHGLHPVDLTTIRNAVS